MTTIIRNVLKNGNYFLDIEEKSFTGALSLLFSSVLSHLVLSNVAWAGHIIVMVTLSHLVHQFASDGFSTSLSSSLFGIR